MFLGHLQMFPVQVISTLYCHAAKLCHCQYISYSKLGSLQLNHVAGIVTVIQFFLNVCIVSLLRNRMVIVRYFGRILCII